MRAALIILLALATPAHADDAYATPACEASRTYCFAIALHVADAVADPAFVAAQVARANELFAPISAGFQVVSADATSILEVADARARRSLAKYVTPGAIHVFLTGALADVDRPGEAIRGVTLRAGEGKYIILSAIAFDRVLAHELGHVFGLPHSTYAVSLMNKTKRSTPPIEERTFAPQEVAAMKLAAARFLRDKTYRDVR